MSFNNRNIYTPPPLLKDFSVSDKALGECISQAIEDFQVRKASALTQLTCSYAGITSLEGIEQFRGLREVNLSDNKISHLTPLSKLPTLTVLIVKNNRIIDPSPLLSNLKLETLNIDGNPDLRCSDLSQLTTLLLQTAESKENKTVVIPRHCR